MNLVDQNEAGCWIWKGKFNGTYGYGCYKIDGRLVTAHRVMYMSIFGRLDRKRFVCHKCDVPACVNPMHMFIGSQQENMQDCRRKNRHFKGAFTKCIHGHEFTPENTRVNFDKQGRPHRTCMICERQRQRTYWREKPELRARRSELRRLRRAKQLPTPEDSKL